MGVSVDVLVGVNVGVSVGVSVAVPVGENVGVGDGVAVGCSGNWTGARNISAVAFVSPLTRLVAFDWKTT